MRPRRPLGVVRPLVPMLGRARCGRYGRSAPMIWRRDRRRAPAALSARAARPLSVSLHYAINLTLTPPSFARGTTVERSFASLVREVVHPGPAGRLGPAGATRRLPAAIERSLQWRDRTRTAALPRTGAVAEGRAPEPRAARAFGPRRLAAPALPLTGRSAALLPAAAARPSRSREPASSADGGTRLAWRQDAAVAAGGAALLPGWVGRDWSAPVRRRRSAPLPSEVEATRRRPHSFLVWREPIPPAEPRHGGGEPRRERRSRREAPDLVWRDPVRSESGRGPMAQPEPLFPARRSAETSAPAAAAAAPVPAAAPGPDVGRLVDEVVRRLERIGRDERLRRGL